MKKYPKTYWNFIKWMYRSLMYRLDKEKNTFRLFKNYDGNKLEFVSFMTFNYSFAYNKIVDEKFKVYYKNFIKQERHYGKTDKEDMEFIALAYADYTGTPVPNGNLKVRQLRPGMIFSDNYVTTVMNKTFGSFKFVGTTLLNGVRYYIFHSIEHDKDMLFNTDAFKNCTVSLFNFYGNRKKMPTTKKEYNKYIFNSREDFTNWLNGR